VFGILATLLINPNNLKMEIVGKDQFYGPEVSNNAMMALRKISVYWALLTIAALFLIKIKTNDELEESNKNKEKSPKVIE
jgi:hypothetical protein